RADHALARAHRVPGAARMRRLGGAGRGTRAGEIGSRAEALSGPGEHDGANRGIVGAALERVEIALAHLGVHRVPGLGPVEAEPADAVLDREEEALRLRHRHTFRLNAAHALSWRKRRSTSGGRSSPSTSASTRSHW